MIELLVFGLSFFAGAATVAIRRLHANEAAARAEAASAERHYEQAMRQLQDAQGTVAQLQGERELAAAQLALLAATTQAATAQAQRAHGVDIGESVQDRFCWN